jgi:hypothetical protein
MLTDGRCFFLGSLSDLTLKRRRVEKERRLTRRVALFLRDGSRWFASVSSLGFA